MVRLKLQNAVVDYSLMYEVFQNLQQTHKRAILSIKPEFLIKDKKEEASMVMGGSIMMSNSGAST